MAVSVANSLPIDQLDLDDSEPLNLEGEEEKLNSREAKRDTCYAPAGLFSMFLSSVVLGACLSVIGPTIPLLMTTTNVRTFSAGVNMISANAAGGIVGVFAAACWLNRRYTSAFASVCTMLCGIVTYVIPQTGSWLSCLLLFFVQGIFLGIIDRGRYNLGPQNLSQMCKSVPMLYLAVSAGGVLPLASISSRQVALRNDSTSHTLPRLFRRHVEEAELFQNGLGLGVNDFFNGSFLASLNKMATDLSNIFRLSGINMTTSLAPQKPKYVDGTGLKTGQTYAERKQQELKQIQAKESATSVAPDAIQLNSSAIVNETLSNVAFDGNSTSGVLIDVAESTLSSITPNSTAAFTDPPQLPASFSTEGIPTINTSQQAAPSTFPELFSVIPQSRPIYEFEESTTSMLSNHSWNSDDAKPLGQILTEAALVFPSAAVAYQTAAWMSIAAIALSFLFYWALFCGQKICDIRRVTQDSKIADVPQSQYTKAALLYGLLFIFFVTAAEGLLTSIIAVFMVARYGTSLQDGVRLCCAVGVFLCVGRLLFLPLKASSGRYVGACMTCSLLLAGCTVLNLNQELFALFNCLFACFLGPVSPLAFCWICKETGYYSSFVTFWSVATHFSRAVVPSLIAWLMDDHQARDYPFGMLSMTLGAVVLLIPLGNAAKQSNQYFASVRKLDKRFDGGRIAYSKLINKTKHDSDCDDEHARAEDNSLFEI